MVQAAGLAKCPVFLKHRNLLGIPRGEAATVPMESSAQNGPLPTAGSPLGWSWGLELDPGATTHHDPLSHFPQMKLPMFLAGGDTKIWAWE